MGQNIEIKNLFNINNRKDLLEQIKLGILKNSNIDNIFNITVLENIINRFSEHYYLKEHGIEKVNDELAIILDNIFNSLSVNRKNEIINELKEIEKNRYFFIKKCILKYQSQKVMKFIQKKFYQRKEVIIFTSLE